MHGWRIGWAKVFRCREFFLVVNTMSSSSKGLIGMQILIIVIIIKSKRKNYSNNTAVKDKLSFIILHQVTLLLKIILLMAKYLFYSRKFYYPEEYQDLMSLDFCRFYASK